MDELVLRLSEGEHPVEISLRTDRSAQGLKKRIDEYGFVHVKFTSTRGGTELGMKVDEEKSDWKSADFEGASGLIRLAGRLNLNGVPVKCITDIDLATLQGRGHLELAGTTVEGESRPPRARDPSAS